jgi:hypothetical protein
LVPKVAAATTATANSRTNQIARRTVQPGRAPGRAAAAAAPLRQASPAEVVSGFTRDGARAAKVSSGPRRRRLARLLLDLADESSAICVRRDERSK